MRDGAHEQSRIPLGQVPRNLVTGSHLSKCRDPFASVHRNDTHPSNISDWWRENIYLLRPCKTRISEHMQGVTKKFTNEPCQPDYKVKGKILSKCPFLYIESHWKPWHCLIQGALLLGGLCSLLLSQWSLCCLLRPFLEFSSAQRSFSTNGIFWPPMPWLSFACSLFLYLFCSLFLAPVCQMVCVPCSMIAPNRDSLLH